MERQEWEGMGAASGLLAAFALIAGFVVFLTTSPTSSPELPPVQNAQLAPAYLAAHLNAYRLELLFMTLGLVLFLWFLGSLWAALRTAEGEPGRGSMVAVVGATSGALLMVVGLVLGFTSAMSTSPAQAETVPMLYTASALFFAIGGGTLSVFFFGVAKVIFQTHVMGTWIGVFAMVVAFLCLPAFVTPFFDSGVLDPATGVLGRWLWFAAAVLWVAVASIVLLRRQRRVTTEASEGDETRTATVPGQREPETETEGVVR